MVTPNGNVCCITYEEARSRVGSQRLILILSESPSQQSQTIAERRKDGDDNARPHASEYQSVRGNDL